MNNNLRTKILVKRMAAVGDCVLVTPIVKELYHRYHRTADITVLTGSPQVFDNNPYCTVKTAETFDPKEQYQTFYDLDLAYERWPLMHISEAYATLVFGNTDMNLQPDIHYTRQDQLIASRGDPGIVLHMRNFAAWPSRQFPEEFWRKTTENLSKLDMPVYIVGQKPDWFFDFGTTVDCRNMFTLQQITALIGENKVFVGADSSILHLASATSTNVAAIFTSAKGEYRRPLRDKGDFIEICPDIECYGCQGTLMAPPITNYGCKRGDLACLPLLDPDTVLAAVQELLN